MFDGAAAFAANSGPRESWLTTLFCSDHAPLSALALFFQKRPSCSFGLCREPAALRGNVFVQLALKDGLLGLYFKTSNVVMVSPLVRRAHRVSRALLALMLRDVDKTRSRFFSLGPRSRHLRFLLVEQAGHIVLAYAASQSGTSTGRTQRAIAAGC